MNVIVEGIVTKPNFVGSPSISNMFDPITARPDVRVTWEREEHRLNASAPKI